MWVAVALPPLLYVGWVRTLQRHRFHLPYPRHHNALLCVYSLVALVGVGVHWGTMGQLPSACVATPRMPGWLTGSWYASKGWEWVDTLLLVRRGKPIRRIHYVHHMITPSLVALQFWNRSHQTPLFEVGTALNAHVHVWMYAYFASPAAWSRLGRVCITYLQVLQHATMFVLLVYTVLTPEACDRDVTYNVVPLLAYAMFAYEFSALLL